MDAMLIQSMTNASKFAGKPRRKTRFNVEYINPRNNEYLTIEHDIRHFEGKTRFMDFMLWATNNAVEVRIRPASE